MRLTIRLLGTEILHVTTEPEYDEDEPLDCTTQPIGFTPSPGSQRWNEHHVPEG